jgi:arabinofuranosyltransferase
VRLEKDPALQRLSGRQGATATAVILGLPAALLAWGFWGYSHDDAFITYRYADQWAHGNGLTFNTGEHVLGTSASGYALLLGLLSRATGFLGVDVPGWGTILSLAAILLISWVLAAGLANAPLPFRWGVPLLFGIGALLLRWNLEMLGSEALLIVSLAAAGAYLVFEKEDLVLGGLALSAAMILRLDAGLAAAGIGIALWLSRRRFPGKFVIAGLLPLGFWLAGLYSRFGTWVPATLAAKRSEYSVAAAAYSLAEWNWLRRSLPLSGCLVLLALALFGGAVCVRHAVWKHPAVLALGSWLIAHEIAYRAIRVPFAPWYHEGLVNAVLILATVGAVALGNGLFSRRPREEEKLGLAPALVACLILLPVLAPSVSYMWEQRGRPPDPRFEIYRSIGQYLRQHARPQATVASVEVGIIGYFSGLPVLDLSGLITPGVVEARSQGRLGQFVAASRPDYILDVPRFRANVLSFLSDPEALKPYRLAQEFSPAPGGACRLLERAP